MPFWCLIEASNPRQRLTQNEGNVPANLRNGLAVPAGHVVGGVVDAHAVFVPFLYELEKFSRN